MLAEPASGPSAASPSAAHTLAALACAGPTLRGLIPELMRSTEHRTAAVRFARSHRLLPFGIGHGFPQSLPRSLCQVHTHCKLRLLQVISTLALESDRPGVRPSHDTVGIKPPFAVETWSLRRGTFPDCSHGLMHAGQRGAVGNEEQESREPSAHGHLSFRHTSTATSEVAVDNTPACLW